MSNQLDADLAAMWRRIAAQSQEIARQEILQLFGANLRGGALNGSVLTGSQSVPPATLPIASTSAVGAIKPDGTTITVDPTTGVATAAGGMTLGPDGHIPSAYLPTIGGTIAEAGRWVRSASNPVLTATVTADESCVQEPCVLYEDGEFKMWYRQGATDEAICYATSPDGVTWTKYGGNPILGQGGSGVSGNAAQPCVIKVDGTYYCYYTEFLGSGNMRVATSSDGLAWTRHSGNVIALISGSTSWGNRTVWQESGTWYMLAEANDSGGVWHIYLASSSDGLTYTLLNSGSELSSLKVHSGGAYGGPWMPTPQHIDGLYHLWYHAVNASGVLPTDIYHATSPDKINWTIVGTGPILTHLGGGSYEHDQVADPHVLEVDGMSYLFYDGDNNTAVTAAIGVAIFPGTLHELVSGAGLVPTLNASGVLPVADLPLATGSTPGIMQPDNTTTTVVGGVVSAIISTRVYAPMVLDDAGATAPTFIVNDRGQPLLVPIT